MILLSLLFKKLAWEDTLAKSHCYACSNLSHSVLYMKFRDAIREGYWNVGVICSCYIRRLEEVTTLSRLLLISHSITSSIPWGQQCSWYGIISLMCMAIQEGICDLHMEFEQGGVLVLTLLMKLSYACGQEPWMYVLWRSWASLLHSVHQGTIWLTLQALHCRRHGGITKAAAWWALDV